MKKQQFEWAKSKHKKEFKRIFDNITQNRNSFQVFSDFINTTTIALHNRIPYDEESERQYLEIAKQYNHKELNQFAELLHHIQMDLLANQWQDFLGTFYMANGYGDVKKGQFFTPFEIASMMATFTLDTELKKEIAEKGYISISDPTAGSGVMMIAAAQVISKQGIDLQNDVVFVAEEIDPLIGKMAYIQMCLLDLPGYVMIHNSLSEPITGNKLFPPETALITSSFYNETWDKRRMEYRTHKGETE